MQQIIRTGGLVLMSLDVSSGLLDHYSGVALLPLGGDHGVQVGIVLGATFVACELRALFIEVVGGRRARARSSKVIRAPHRSVLVRIARLIRVHAHRRSAR